MYLDPAIAYPACPAAAALAALPVTPPPQHFGRRAERVSFDLLVRYAWRGLRATVLLKDLSRFGARTLGLDALRKSDVLTLLLPGLPTTCATVAWSSGGSAGLFFDQPLDLCGYEALVANFAATPPPDDWALQAT